MILLQEVLQQGEQLDNIEKNTDHIIQSGKESQIYLNNIKSVFGGLKNWWHGKKDASKGGEVEKPERNTAADLRDSGSDPPVAGPAPTGFVNRQQQQHKPDSYDSQLTEDLCKYHYHIMLPYLLHWMGSRRDFNVILPCSSDVRVQVSQA